MLKLKEFAEKMRVSYKTAHRWWCKGLLNGFQVGKNKMILIDEKNPLRTEENKEESEIRNEKLETDYLNFQDILKMYEQVTKSYNNEIENMRFTRKIYTDLFNCKSAIKKRNAGNKKVNDSTDMLEFMSNINNFIDE